MAALPSLRQVPTWPRSGAWPSRRLAALPTGSCIVRWALSRVLGDREEQLAEITVGCVLHYLRWRNPEPLALGRWPVLAAFAERRDGVREFALTRPADGERMPAGL